MGKVKSPRYKVGQRVWIWKPGHAEHGATSVIRLVEKYQGPESLDTWAYYPCKAYGWLQPDSCLEYGFGSLPERMLIDRDPYNRDDD